MSSWLAGLWALSLLSLGGACSHDLDALPRADAGSDIAVDPVQVDAPQADVPADTAVDMTALDMTMLDTGAPDASACDEPCLQDRPVCPATGVCEGCAGEADCARFRDAQLCVDGSCVQCTEAMSGACDGNGCNDATNRCSGNPPESVGPCGECEAEEDCGDGFVCVPTQFNGEAVPGTFCLPQRCTPPFGARGMMVQTIEGRDAIPCTLSTTSCPAYNDYQVLKMCFDDGNCGVAGRNDGRCPSGRCTIPCTGVMHCAPEGTCDKGVCL